MPSRQAALKVSSSKPSLSLLFSFSLQTSCLGPCPLGKWKVICLEELLAQWENLLVLDNQRTACELQKLHVIRFCNPIRPERVILNQENYVMSSPVSLKWKVVIKWVNRCLAIYFDITLEVMWVFFSITFALCVKNNTFDPWYAGCNLTIKMACMFCSLFMKEHYRPKLKLNLKWVEIRKWNAQFLFRFFSRVSLLFSWAKQS